MKSSLRRIFLNFMILLLLTLPLVKPLVAQPASGQATVQRIEWTNHFGVGDLQSFTLDAVHLQKSESQQAAGFLTVTLNGKMMGLRYLPLPDAAGTYKMGELELTLEGDPQEYNIKVILLQNLQGLIPLTQAYRFGDRAIPVLASLSTERGSFGTPLTLLGSDFASTPELNTVRFRQADGQVLTAAVTTASPTRLDILAPVLNAGVHNIEVEVDGRISNQLTFLAEALPQASGNETLQLLEVTQTLLGNMDDLATTLQAAALPVNLQDQVTQLLNDADSQMSAAQSSLSQYSPEAQDLINRILVNSGLPEQLAPMGSSNTLSLLGESGQDYTVGDRLEKVDEIMEDVRSARNTMRSLNRSLQVLEASLVVGGVAGLIFGGSGAGALALAAEIESFRQAVIQPVLLSLRAIYTVLSCSTTSAVAGSLRFDYVDDLQIEQYFGHAQEPAMPEWQVQSLSSRLVKVKVSVEELQYLQDDLLHLLQKPYGYGNTVLPSGYSDSLLQWLRQFPIYSEQWNTLTQEDDGTLLPAETLRNNAPEILSLLKQYRKIGAQVVSGSDALLFDLLYAQSNLLMTFDSDWLGSFRYAMGDIIREANGLHSLLNKLISEFQNPEELQFDTEPPAYSGFVDTTGVLLAGQSYVARGNIDFNVGLDETVGLDNMLDGIGTSLIVDLVGGIVDLDLELENVPVRLSATSSNETVLRAEWSDAVGLRLIPLKPGSATLTIVPNIRLVREGRIKEEYLSVTKTFQVLSANQTTEEFQFNAPMGPRLDYVKDETDKETRQVYLGDPLTLQGLGFASSGQHMNLYWQGVPALGIVDLVPDFLQSSAGNEQERRLSIQFEVPDTLSGQLRVAVHLKQAMQNGVALDKEAGSSNTVAVEVLPPEIDFMPTNLIEGESYPVLGKGFSHTPLLNKIIFDGFEASDTVNQRSYYAIVEPALNQPFTAPQEYAEADAGNHDLLHVLHERLTFLVNRQTPSSQQNRIKVLETEVMADSSNGSVVQTWGATVAFSQNGQTSMRPLLAEDTDSGRRMAIWVHLNEQGAAQWIAAEVNAEGKMGNPQKVADHLGSMETAPDKGALTAYNGRFYFVYASREGEKDVLYCSIFDGAIWNTPIALTSGDKSALKPALWVGDLHKDGQEKLLLLYLADNGRVSQTMANWFTMHNGIVELLDQVALSDYSISRPALTQHEDGFFVAYQEIKERHSDLYVRFLQVKTDGTQLLPQNAIKVSSNSGERQASNPSMVMGVHPVSGIVQVVVVWENSVSLAGEIWGVGARGQREDVFLATIRQGSASEPVNLTHSSGHSQSPQLSLGSDGSIALLFLETLPSEVAENQNQGFTSQVWFTRSFDGGEHFQRPFLRVANYTNGIRLGHPVLLNRGEGKVNLLWQAGDALCWLSSGETLTPPLEYPLNTEIPRKQVLNYASDALGLRLLNSAGEPLRFLSSATANMQEYSNEFQRLAVSPSGRYLGIPGYYMQIAEADGSHILDIALIHAIEKELPKHIAWGLEEDELRVSYVEFGLSEAHPNGTWQHEAISGEEDRSYGLASDSQEWYLMQREWQDSIPTLHRDYYLVNSQSGEERYLTSLPNRVLALSPTGNEILLYEARAGIGPEGLVLRQMGGSMVLLGEGEPEAAAFSADGGKVAAIMRKTATTAVLKLWDITLGTVWEQSLSIGLVARLTFSPDGTKVFWQSSEGLWQANTLDGNWQNAIVFGQNHIQVGQGTSELIISGGISLWKNRSGGQTEVVLRHTPIADVTVQIIAPPGLTVLPQEITFVAGVTPTVRRISVFASDAQDAGISMLALHLSSMDLRFAGVKQHVTVITSEAQPFTSGAGYAASGYGSDAIYPILHNWNRQVPVAAAALESPLWQLEIDYNEVKVLQASQGVTLVYGRDYTYHVEAYRESGQQLWETSGKSPLLIGEEAVFLWDNQTLVYKHLLSGVERFVSLHRADGGTWQFWTTDLFFADDQGRLYATAERQWGDTFLHILRIDTDGRVIDVLVDDRELCGEAIPVVTQDGKLLMWHNQSVGIWDLTDFDSYLTHFGVDGLLQGSKIDTNSPQNAVYYLLNAQGAEVLMTAMTTKDFSPLWQRVLPGTLAEVQQPAIDKNGVLYLAVGSEMLALRGQDGRLLWQEHFDESISGLPVLDARDELFFTVGDDLLHMNATGQILQRKSFGDGGQFAVNVSIGHQGQVVFGGGMSAAQTRYPLIAMGVIHEPVESFDVRFEDSLVRVREDDGELRLRLLDQSVGIKGGFEVEVQLLPLTAVQGVDYQLNYRNSTGRVVFDEGATEAWLIIDIFEGFEEQESREFLVKIIGITPEKTYSNAVLTVRIEDISMAVDQRSKVGWSVAEALVKEGESYNLVLKRSRNALGELPEQEVRLQVGSPGSYFAYEEAQKEEDYNWGWTTDTAGRILLRFHEGETELSMPLQALVRDGQNGMRKLDVRVIVNSTVEPDFGMPQTYESNLKVYVAEADFEIPLPRIKQTAENEWKVSNILYFGWFEIYTPEGQLLQRVNGYLNTLDGEYPLYDLPHGNGYTLRSGFADYSRAITLNIP